MGGKTYIDHNGRKFTSMPALCRANNIDYAKFYYQVHVKNKSVEETAEKLAGRGSAGSGRNSMSWPLTLPVFYPLSELPSKEFKRYLEYQIKHIDHNTDIFIKNMIDPKTLKRSIRNQTDDLPEYWFEVADMIACGRENELAPPVTDKVIKKAKLLMQYGIGLYIYGDFSRRYNLGMFRKDR